MKDYYNSFVNLSLQQGSKNDYSDKAKLKMHNAASKQLQQLQNIMKESDCTEVLCKLLSHEDERVRINAASLCLQMGVLIEKTNCVLRNIMDSSDDATMRFSAKIILQNRT